MGVWNILAHTASISSGDDAPCAIIVFTACLTEDQRRSEINLGWLGNVGHQVSIGIGDGARTYPDAIDSFFTINGTIPHLFITSDKKGNICGSVRPLDINSTE